MRDMMLWARLVDSLRNLEQMAWITVENRR